MKVLRRGIKKDFCVVVYLRHAGFFNYTRIGESEKISILAWRSDLWLSTQRWQQTIKIRLIRATGGETYEKENTGDNWSVSYCAEGINE